MQESAVDSSENNDIFIFYFLFQFWASKIWCSPSNPSHVHIDTDRGSGEQTSHTTNVKAFSSFLFFSLLLSRYDILPVHQSPTLHLFTWMSPLWSSQSQLPPTKKLPHGHQHFIKLATGGSTKIRKLLIWIIIVFFVGLLDTCINLFEKREGQNG